MPALAATVECLETYVRYTVLIRFPIIAQCSNGVNYFHKSCWSSGFHLCQWEATVKVE